MSSEMQSQEGGWQVGPPQPKNNNAAKNNKPAAPAPAKPAAAAPGDAKPAAPAKSKSVKKHKSKTPSKHSNKSNAPNQPSRHNLLSILAGGNSAKQHELRDLMWSLS